MISTREALVGALSEAAELEHGLLLQYLFAALSMKKDLAEDLTAEEQEATREWEGKILTIARQEMAHLGTVCNLLSAVGAAPRFGRPNFPQPAKTYYPFDFELTRFSDESLYRFVRFELPKGEPAPPPPHSLLTGKHPLRLMTEMIKAPVVPEPLEYEYVGELYGQIRGGFGRIPEDQLFVGPRFAQDTDDWSRRMNLLLVVDRQTADKAIDSIVLEGEGSPANREGSHYATFRELREALSTLQNANPDFDPARPVAKNPRTRDHRDSPTKGTIISKATTVEVAELFNACYACALLMLMQFYSYGGESTTQRRGLQQAIREMMSAAMRPIAEVLTTLAVADAGGERAGPTFELYADLRLPTQPLNRWQTLLERLGLVADDATRLSVVNARLGFVGENLRWLRLNLRGLLTAEFVPIKGA